MVKKRDMKLALLVLAPVIGALVIWASLALVLGAEHPVLVVKGHSMEPTLEPGDLVFVEAVKVEEVKVGPDGDIVAFYDPRPGHEGDIIIHRAVKRVKVSGKLFLRTQGDNRALCPEEDPWLIGDEQLIGKVVAKVPAVGAVIDALAQFVRSPVGLCIVAIFYGLFVSEVLGLRGRKKG